MKNYILSSIVSVLLMSNLGQAKGLFDDMPQATKMEINESSIICTNEKENSKIVLNLNSQQAWLSVVKGEDLSLGYQILELTTTKTNDMITFKGRLFNEDYAGTISNKIMTLVDGSSLICNK